MQILTLKTAVLLASVATALCALSTSSSAQVPSPEKIKQLEQLARDLAGRSDGCVALNQPALVRARQASKAGVTSRLTYIRTGISSKLSPGDRRVLDQAAARPGANFAGMSLWINNREKSAVYVLATDALQKSGRQGTKTIGLLGGALNSLYLYEETIALLQAAVNEKRADAAVLHNLGVAYGALGDRQTAMGYLTEARSRAPHLGEIVGALGVLLRCEGKGEEAKAALRLAQALRWSGHDARQLEALREELGDSSSEPPVPAPGEPTSVNRVENGDDSEDGGDQESERDSDSERDSEVSEESGSDGSGSDSGPSKASKGFGPKAAPFTLPRFPASADNFIANQRLWQQLWSESASRYRGLAEQLTRERLAMPETDPVVGEGEAYDLLIEDQLVSLSNYYSERLSYETGGTGVGSGSSYDDRMTRVNEASQKAARLRLQASPGLYESTHSRHAEHCSAWRGDASGFFMQYKTLASLGSQSQIVVDYLTRAMAWANMTSDPQVRKKRQLEVLENYYLFVTQLHGVPMKAAGSWSVGWSVGYATCGPAGNNTYVSEKPPPPENPSPPDDKPCPKLGAEFGRGAASASVEITCGKVKFAVDALIFRTAVEQNMKDKSGEIFLGLSVAPSAGLTVAGVSRFVEAEFEAGFYTSFDSSGRVSDFGVVERSSVSSGTEASIGAASVRVSRELKSTESRTSFDESFVSLFTGDSALTTSPPAGASGSLAPRVGSTGR